MHLLKNILTLKNNISPTLLSQLSKVVLDSDEIIISQVESLIDLNNDHNINEIKNYLKNLIEKHHAVSCISASMYVFRYKLDAKINSAFNDGFHLQTIKGQKDQYIINTTQKNIACLFYLGSNVTTNVHGYDIDLNNNIIIYPLKYPYIFETNITTNDIGVLCHFETSDNYSNDITITHNNILRKNLDNTVKYGYVDDKIFFTKFYSNHGLLACATMILQQLILYRGTIKSVNTQNKLGYDFYKKGYNSDLNLWPILYNINDTVSIPCTSHIFNKKLNELVELTEIDLVILRPYILKYFQPSEKVISRTVELITKYQLNLNNLLVIHYRGTDRKTYNFIKPFNLFIDKARDIVNKNPNLQILIQSDDGPILIKLVNEFPDAITITEPNFYPAADGFAPHYAEADKETIVHAVEPSGRESLMKDGISHAIDYLAFIIIASKAKFIVTHKGNGPFWTLLYRDSLENFIQL